VMFSMCQQMGSFISFPTFRNTRIWIHRARNDLETPPMQHREASGMDVDGNGSIQAKPTLAPSTSCRLFFFIIGLII
jgi:hypothetical protein